MASLIVLARCSTPPGGLGAPSSLRRCRWVRLMRMVALGRRSPHSRRDTHTATMGWGDEGKKEFQEPTNTERDVLVYEINEISNETLESTRNMRRMCEESKDMGQKTMGMLENQGESIENWEEVADGINEDMKLAEKALKDMDRACFGFIPRFWKVSQQNSTSQIQVQIARLTAIPQIGGGFKEDDAVWKEPENPRNEQLPELKV